MKRVVVFVLLGLFLCVAGATVFLETSAGVRWIQAQLLRSLERSGIRVEIESIGGRLPEHMSLQGVRISDARGHIISIDHLEFELSLIRLLKREVSVRSLNASGIRFSGDTSGGNVFPLPVLVKVQSFHLENVQGLEGVVLTGKLKAKHQAKLALTASAKDYTVHLSAVGTIDAWTGQVAGTYQDWTFGGHVHHADTLWQLDRVTASNGQFEIKGNGELGPQWQPLHGQLQLTMPSTKLFATTTFQAKGQALETEGHWRLPTIPVEGTWKGTIVSKLFTGTTKATGVWVGEQFAATANATYRFQESLQLEQIVLQSVLGQAQGNLVLRPDLLWVGQMQFQDVQLHVLKIPMLSGTASGKCALEVVEEKQAAKVDAVGSEVLWDKVYAKEAIVYADLGAKKHFHAAIKQAQWKELVVDAAEADFGETGPFAITLDGTLKEKLYLTASGEIQPGQVKLTRLRGSIVNQPVALTNPTAFSWNPTGWALDPLTFSVGQGTTLIEGNSSGHLTVHMTQMPLNLFELGPLHLPVKGTVDANAVFTETKGQLQGNWTLALHQLQVSGRERKAEGTITGTVSGERVQTQIDLQSNAKKLFTLEADVPVQMHLWPFEANLVFNKRATGRLVMDGAVEDVFDFFDLGTHRFTGHWTCDLGLRGTLGNPRLEGYCEIEDGSYENYLTGTVLTRMQGSITAEQARLHLRNLRAETGEGKLTGVGTLHLNKREKFPFEMHLDFQKLNVAQIDLVSATAEGRISIYGNLDGADARGKVQVLDAQFSIPEKIPTPLPDLPVVYKNGSEAPIAAPPKAYPLRLHLDVQAPKGIFIQGRGLQSEWQGNFHIGGTYTSIAAKGNLELLGGKFEFSGREFTLTQGSLTFSGHEYEMPKIDLAGHMAERGISITARLQGPLNAPQLTFQSTPPLPFGSIMSYLLFGKDISEIDGFQAIQLAGSVASIAGTSPGLLEDTRKSLGVDRLRIISSGNGEDGNTVAIQVGKYVAKGVLVSFSQGADDSSTNVSIEVDLKHGFVFQAESEQQEEQGKFTLKWNTNY